MKWINAFIYSSGVILLAAALMRFFIAAGSAQALALPEPMLGVSIRLAVTIVGAFELAGALLCLFGNWPGLQIGCLAWFATDFLAYRIGLVSMHCHPQATCLGSLTDPLRLAHGIMGFAIGWMPYYLLLGSYAAAIWYWRDGGISQTTLKMFCPSCGGKIQFSIQNLGRKIPCPLCKTTLTLRAPENLKMSCSFCKDHIEFPAHALGQKIPCPHCNMTVILKEQL
jgi:DNA-directed RNA polymerase subunit RPC12/RpoP